MLLFDNYLFFLLSITIKKCDEEISFELKNSNDQLISKYQIE